MWKRNLLLRYFCCVNFEADFPRRHAVRKRFILLLRSHKLLCGFSTSDWIYWKEEYKNNFSFTKVFSCEPLEICKWDFYPHDSYDPDTKLVKSMLRRMFCVLLLITRLSDIRNRMDRHTITPHSPFLPNSPAAES